MKYGFVYIWKDSARSKIEKDEKKVRFYIGRHWGTEDDGYICSSNWMRDARRRRPQDFKRRVLSRHETKEELLEAEFEWLRLIPDEELGKKYYNLRKDIFGILSHSEETKKNMKGRKFSLSHCKNISKGKLGHDVLPETREKLRQVNLGKKHKEETKKKIGRNGEENGFFGKKHKEETLNHLSEVRKGKPWSEARRLAQINKSSI